MKSTLEIDVIVYFRENAEVIISKDFIGFTKVRLSNKLRVQDRNWHHSRHLIGCCYCSSHPSESNQKKAYWRAVGKKTEARTLTKIFHWLFFCLNQPTGFANLVLLEIWLVMNWGCAIQILLWKFAKMADNLWPFHVYYSFLSLNFARRVDFKAPCTS